MASLGHSKFPIMKGIQTEAKRFSGGIQAQIDKGSSQGFKI